MGFHLAAAALMLSATAASAAGPIVVHRDPGCGCCEQWAAQVRTQFDRSVRMVDDQNRSALQRARGVPASLSSCHPALIDVMRSEEVRDGKEFVRSGRSRGSPYHSNKNITVKP